MSEIELIQKSVKGKDCLSLKWRNIHIGYIYTNDEGNWRISDDKKGEFWALDDYPSKDSAIEALVQKKQTLDDFRLSQISTQK